MFWFRKSPVFYLPPGWFGPAQRFLSLPFAPAGRKNSDTRFILAYILIVLYRVCQCSYLVYSLQKNDQGCCTCYKRFCIKPSNDKRKNNLNKKNCEYMYYVHLGRAIIVFLYWFYFPSVNTSVITRFFIPLNNLSTTCFTMQLTRLGMLLARFLIIILTYYKLDITTINSISQFYNLILLSLS